jgi:hypothetical protein
VNPLEAVKSIKRPSLKRPSFKRPSLKRPSFTRPSFKRPSLSMPSLSIPSPWLVGALLLVHAWIGWAIYTATDRGADAGLGVLVAWPTLLLMAALVAAPFAAIAYFVTRLVRNQRLAATGTGTDGDEDSDEDENVTTSTSPL